MRPPGSAASAAAVGRPAGTRLGRREEARTAGKESAEGVRLRKEGGREQHGRARESGGRTPADRRSTGARPEGREGEAKARSSACCRTRAWVGTRWRRLRPPSAGPGPAPTRLHRGGREPCRGGCGARGAGRPCRGRRGPPRRAVTGKEDMETGRVFWVSLSGRQGRGGDEGSEGPACRATYQDGVTGLETRPSLVDRREKIERQGLVRPDAVCRRLLVRREPADGLVERAQRLAPGRSCVRVVDDSRDGMCEPLGVRVLGEDERDALGHQRRGDGRFGVQGEVVEHGVERRSARHALAGLVPERAVQKENLERERSGLVVACSVRVRGCQAGSAQAARRPRGRVPARAHQPASAAQLSPNSRLGPDVVLKILTPLAQSRSRGSSRETAGDCEYWTLQAAVWCAQTGPADVVSKLRSEVVAASARQAFGRQRAGRTLGGTSDTGSARTWVQREVCTRRPTRRQLVADQLGCDERGPGEEG